MILYTYLTLHGPAGTNNSLGYLINVTETNIGLHADVLKVMKNRTFLFTEFMFWYRFNMIDYSFCYPVTMSYLSHSMSKALWHH